MNQITNAKIENAKIIILGDFNAKTGEIIDGNNKETDTSGRLINKNVEKNDITIINTIEKCNGNWTRKYTSNDQEKSILDYIPCSKNI